MAVIIPERSDLSGTWTKVIGGNTFIVYIHHKGWNDVSGKMVMIFKIIIQTPDSMCHHTKFRVSSIP